MTNRIRYKMSMGLGAAGLLLASTATASNLVQDDLLTSASGTSPWQECGTDATGIDVSAVGDGSCAYRSTPAEPGITYKMTCAVTSIKYSSITLSFLDADDNTLAEDTVDIFENVSGPYSVTLQSPAGTTTAAIGIYGEHGSGFQDCVLVDVTPAPEPTKGSIAGVTWFDEDLDSMLSASEDLITGTRVDLIVNGAAVDTTTTGADGAYYFGNLDVDACYTIAFFAADATIELGQQGGDNDANASGLTSEICLTETAPDVTDIDAGFVAIPPVIPPADYAICGIAWSDANGNGMYEGGDSALGNVVVRLIDITNGASGDITTSSKGSYAFTDLAEGDYRIEFVTPDGYEVTVQSAALAEGKSYVNADGQSPVINIPGDGNTSADSACTVQFVNAGYKELPVVLPPTTATDDSVENLVGTDFAVDILANDAPCEGAVDEVNLLGHNVPGNVVYDATTGMLMVTDTTAAGTYTVKYGVRGVCGSYATATVTIVLEQPAPPVQPNAPDAPECRVETGGSVTYGGVDVFEDAPDGFAEQYNLYDRKGDLITTMSSSDRTFLYHQTNPSAATEPYRDMWEIEWTGSQYGFDQISVYYISAVTGGIESELTECARHNISPIALDLENQGRVHRILGNFEVDLDADGTPEALSQWFAPTAGILVVGQPEGKVNGEQLFGNLAGVYADGFAKLATFDLNKDGQVAGKELAGLSIWNDLNSNTEVDAGELSTLASHELVSLAVEHYKYLARAQKADGKSILMEDVWFPLAPVAQLGQ